MRRTSLRQRETPPAPDRQNPPSKRIEQRRRHRIPFLMLN